MINHLSLISVDIYLQSWWTLKSTELDSKFRESGGHGKHNCLHDLANFHRSQAKEINFCNAGITCFCEYG